MENEGSIVVNTVADDEAKSRYEQSPVALDIRDILHYLDIPLERVPDDLQHLFDNGDQDNKIGAVHT